MNVFFAGPGKCGTTFLYNTFFRYYVHSVNLSLTKETNFLLSSRNDKDIQDYSKYFKTNLLNAPYIEFSNLYFFSTAFVENLKYFDSPKVILTLRDPVERVYSHLMQYNRVDNDISFDNLLLNHQDVLARSMYSCQMKKFHAFPKSDLLILTLEDIRTAPISVMSRIEQFINYPLPSLSIEDLDLVSSNKAKSSRNSTLTRILKLSFQKTKHFLPEFSELLRSSSIVDNLVYRPTSKCNLQASDGFDLYLRNFFVNEYSYLLSEWGIDFSHA